MCDGQGPPVVLLLSEGQMSDHKGAALTLDALPPARVLIADRGYDSDDYREALFKKRIVPCIPPRRNRKVQIAYDADLYRQRHRIENMFAKLKDWRRRHPLRPMRPHLHVSHRHHSNHALLDQSMSPEPRAPDADRRTSYCR